MYVNNLPFTETLHQAQTDLYDIHTLLLDPMKKMEKTAKRKKVMWQLASLTEHSVGVAFGVLTIIEFYHQRYFLGCLYMPFLAIGAISGFDSGAMSNKNGNYAKQLKEMIKNTQNAIDASLPEQLHEIAEIVRNNKKQR